MTEQTQDDLYPVYFVGTSIIYGRENRIRPSVSQEAQFPQGPDQSSSSHFYFSDPNYYEDIATTMPASLAGSYLVVSYAL